MAIEYGKNVQEVYGLNSEELYKADVITAALLKGYCPKEGENASFFMKISGGKVQSSFSMPEGPLSETDKRVIDWNLGTKNRALDESYYSTLVKNYDDKKASALFAYANESVDNLSMSDNAKAFCSARIEMANALYMQKQSAGESGR